MQRPEFSLFQIKLSLIVGPDFFLYDCFLDQKGGNRIKNYHQFFFVDIVDSEIFYDLKFFNIVVKLRAYSILRLIRAYLS